MRVEYDDGTLARAVLGVSRNPTPSDPSTREFTGEFTRELTMRNRDPQAYPEPFQRRDGQRDFSP